MPTTDLLLKRSERGLLSQSALSALLVFPPARVARVFAAQNVQPDEEVNQGRRTLRFYSITRVDELAAVLRASEQALSPTPKK